MKTYTILGRVIEIRDEEDHEPRDAEQPAGEAGIGQVSLSSAAVAAGERVRASARIGCKGVAYIYAEAMLCDAPSGRLYGPLLREHIRAPRARETGGVTRPDWDESVEVGYDYRPGLRLLISGEGLTFAFLAPGSYPTAGVEMAWTAEGQYTLAATGKMHRAVLSFGSDGALRRATVFKKGRVGEKPSAVTIRRGDTFVPRGLSVRRDAGGGWLAGSALASSLTLQGATVRWEEHSLPVGEVYLGFAVKDIYDRWTRRYAPLLIGA